MTKPTAVVTGSAGFIGYHVCNQLLDAGYAVTGIDSLSDYYDVDLKKARHARLEENNSFRSVISKIEVPGLLETIFKSEYPEIVVHLAAQAGVRYSIENPRSYLESNIIGTFELLEAARKFPPKHLLLASTSSAYGANDDYPYTETQKADMQVSFYAATKKSTENMAHSYAHLFGLPITMFRFFTVYGPWGRPDMALFKFTKAILKGQEIDVYNAGEMWRDFTYIDDLVHAIILLKEKPPATDQPALPENRDSLSAVAPFRVVNIGNGESVKLTDFIDALEAELRIPVKRNLMPMQAGDVVSTWASNDLLKAITDYKPTTGVQQGIVEFVSWYKSYYGLV